MDELTQELRFRLSLQALEGLSVGDAFGQQFFLSEDEAYARINSRELPAPQWPFTDDTMMALSVCDVLGQFGRINQDALVESFCRHFQPERGYGASMRRLLSEVAAGGDWRLLSAGQFSGMGSHGNGAAMRVAPLGAYFFDDLDRVVDEATLSAVVTHTHPDGVAGAVAVAVAAALACRAGREGRLFTSQQFLTEVAEHVGSGQVRRGIEAAVGLPTGASVRLAVAALGNGIGLSAADTVPFSLWVAARRLTDFEGALWEIVGGLGDRDTTCAIVGGIIALSVGPNGLPRDWVACREELPNWLIEAHSPSTR